MKKDFNLMNDISKSASMQETTIVKKSLGGRPRVKNRQSSKLTVNLTEEEARIIDELAEAKMVSKSQLIKMILYEVGTFK